MSPKSSKRDDYIPNPDFFNNKEQCHICKSRGAFICEHDTVVRDNLKNTYAEDGRYYMSARNLSRSEQYSESLRNGSGINSAGSRQNYLDSKLLLSGNKKQPKLFLSTANKNYGYNRNGYLNRQKSQQQTTVKKSRGCCSISSKCLFG